MPRRLMHQRKHIKEDHGRTAGETKTGASRIQKGKNLQTERSAQLSQQRLRKSEHAKAKNSTERWVAEL